MSTGPTSQTQPTEHLLNARKELLRLFRSREISDDELLVNLCLYMRSGALAKILFLNEIYQKIVEIPGVVCEFGIWWGQSLVVFENLRAIYEPYNYTRRVIGFDTFSGGIAILPGKTTDHPSPKEFTVFRRAMTTILRQLLAYHEQENVMSHIRKHELVKGDATVSAGKWFTEHPEILVALAFFDMALYEPTRASLEAIQGRQIKGSVVAFDELSNSSYPGETRAALEVLGTKDFSIYRSKFLPDRSYFVKN